MVARRQLLALGWTSAQARQRVITGRWVRVLPGVYATFTGEPSELSRVWAAVLLAGSGAAATHETSLWLAGARTRPVGLIHIAVHASRNVRTPAWVRLHRSRSLRQALHPSATPPRTRIEEAALDCCDATTSLDTALGVIFTVTQRRLTTSDRLRAALKSRTRHRWRALLSEVLTEVEDGVASPLEHRYARNVERRHGLPVGVRNQAEAAPGGGTWYRDVRYPEFTTIVELDGIEAHPGEHRFRDLRRDNHAAVCADSVLRYGWRDVAGKACDVAQQVGAVLRARGWQGHLKRCGPTCSIPLSEHSPYRV